MDKIYQVQNRVEGIPSWKIVKAENIETAISYFAREYPNAVIEKVELLANTEII